MKKILARIALGVIVFNVLMVIAAQIAKRMLPVYGDADSDVFSLVAAMDGVEFASRSSALRAGSGTAIMGGISLDLSDAELATSANLELTAITGGIEVVVPSTWRVEMITTAFAGGSENLTDPDATQVGAPLLVVDARTYFGGVSIRPADAG
jgi:hypothetical protein